MNAPLAPSLNSYSESGRVPLYHGSSIDKNSLVLKVVDLHGTR